MTASPEAPLVFVVESARNDEALTIRALRASGIPLRTEVSRAGDEAIARYRAEFASSPPRLVVVADGPVRVSAHGVVAGVREIHAAGAVGILHLLATDGHPRAAGASGWVVKPIAYEEYLAAVGAAAGRLLGVAHA